MLWIQGWITNSIVLPLVKQARNRIKNIKVVKEANGKYNFYNGENVATEIPTTKVVKNSNGTTTLTTGDEVVTIGRTKAEAENIATQATMAGNSTLNPNPYFTRGTLDYDSYLANNKVKYVRDKVPNAAGAIELTDSGITLVGDTFCPMPQNMQYRASIDVMAEADGLPDPKNGHLLFYMGIVSYDSDKRPIYPQEIGYVNIDGGITPNTTPMVMELTRDLTDLDIYFVFQTGAIDKVRQVDKPHFRALKFHKKQPNGDYSYVGINGRVYDHLGMSKDNKYNGWDVVDDTKEDTDPLKYMTPTGEVVNGKDEYRMKLTSALTPKNATITYNIGDVFVQTFGGGTYSYWLSAQSFPVDGKWHHFDSGWFNAKDQEGMNAYGKYRNGTAYVKLMLLPSYYYRNDDHGNAYVKAEEKIKAYYGNIALLKRNP